jgi:NDP-sugar pyrophosphorylase family protein
MSETMLPVAILAGGLATRLRPVTKSVPKVLLDVHGEPFITHQLRLLRCKGIERVVLCLGYLGEKVREYAGSGEQFGVHIDYSFDGPVLLGTAGAICRALPLLGDQFFVLYGDSYLPCDYRAVVHAFRTSRKLALMTVFRNDGQWDVSNVEFAQGEILAYDKHNRTPRMRHIDYGLGVFKAAAFEEIPGKQPGDLTALYQGLLGRGELAAFEVKDRFYQIGSFEGWRETAEMLRIQNLG